MGRFTTNHEEHEEYEEYEEADDAGECNALYVLIPRDLVPYRPPVMMTKALTTGRAMTEAGDCTSCLSFT